MRNIPFGKPIIGDIEKQAVLDVLSGDILVHGPKAKQFEGDFCTFTKSLYAVSVSSCTAALHLAYFNLGIGSNDEVIVPAQTHNATAHAVELCNARPVFVDAELSTGNIDLDQIEAAITARTKAISIVHYLGMPVNMDRVTQLAKKYGLFVVEDCALAIGTLFNGTHAGLFGDVGCFSFYPVKHFTTAEGGMLTTQNESIANLISRKKAFGVDRRHEERQVPGVYDVTMLGLNYRMNELSAAMGSVQLQRVPEFLKTRRSNFEFLYEELQNLSEIALFKTSSDQYQSSYYCFTVLLSAKIAKKRFEIVSYLKERGIGTSVYYPKPVPHFTYYRNKYGYDLDSSFPVASQISNSSIAFPVGPHLNLEDMKYIVDIFKEALVKLK